MSMLGSMGAGMLGGAGMAKMGGALGMVQQIGQGDWQGLLGSIAKGNQQMAQGQGQGGGMQAPQMPQQGVAGGVMPQAMPNAEVSPQEMEAIQRMLFNRVNFGR